MFSLFKISIISLFIIGIIAAVFHYAAVFKKDDELKDKIGQMLMVGFRGTEALADSYIATVIYPKDVAGIGIPEAIVKISKSETGREIESKIRSSLEKSRLSRQKLQEAKGFVENLIKNQIVKGKIEI